MKVIVVKDYEAMSELGAQIIGDMIKNNPSCTLGLATGPVSYTHLRAHET